MSTSKFAELHRRYLKKAVDLPLANRVDRDVPCRPCVAAMMMLSGRRAHRTADTCRNFMVGCTDKREYTIMLDATGIPFR